MKAKWSLPLFTLIIFLISCTSSQKQEKSKQANNVAKEQAYGIVIHGGAGGMKKDIMSDSLQTAYREKLKEATEAGYQVLESGGKSVDAIIAAIEIMENSTLFNAGKGAVFTHDEKNELDASIMNGADLNAGAVAGATQIKNPIKAARAVMDKSPHVILSGIGANQFAIDQGLDTVNNSYFFTPQRFKYLQRAKQKAAQSAYHPLFDLKYGTVGAVCLDKDGNLAAGTSTGGMTNKHYGRIGDSPIIGAGTYANKLCAVSCTGHGEYFIRYAVAYDLAAQMKYKNKSLKDAGNQIINKKLKSAGGDGGLISIDKEGNINMPFNTSGMFRAFKTNEKSLQTLIFKAEEESSP